MSDTVAEGLHEWQLALLPALWGASIGVALFALLGYLSWRVLSRLPDFPEKSAMVRGSVWAAPALAVLAAVPFLSVWFGAGLGLPMAGLGIGKALFWAGFAWLYWRFRPEMDGMFKGVTYWLRYRKRGLEAFRSDHLAAREKLRRYDRIVGWCWPVLVACWLGLGVWGYWHVDRMVIGAAADERLVAMLKQELGDPRVVDVMAMRAGFEGPLYPMLVHVTAATTAEQARAMAERLRQALARRGDKSAWFIEVRAKYKRDLASAMYVPPGVTLPPGIERQPARPRKW